MAAEERRRQERFPIIVDCRIEGISGGAAMRVTDISLGGCYIDTAIPFPDGANITVSVTLGETEVALRGRIIHTQPNHGFAIELNRIEFIGGLFRGEDGADRTTEKYSSVNTRC